ncbi:MAG: hypothetical protein RIC35_02235 [Marinoscillum sp.]
MDHFYKYYRWLSLDIVLGAIFFLAYLEKFFQVSLAWNVYFALGSAIWLIYTTDHLIDAKSVDRPTSGRHLFHQRFFSLLIFAGGLIFMAALINIYFLDVRIIKNGALLSALCIGYLLAVYFFKKLWIKEVLVAGVYALGIFLAPATLTRIELSAIPLIIQLFSVALLNLLVFSYYDVDSDKEDGFNSLVIRLGKVKSSQLIKGIVIVIIVSVICFSWSEINQIQGLYFVMTCTLLLVHCAPKFFKVNDRYRTVGDGIFYLPGLLLLL